MDVLRKLSEEVEGVMQETLVRRRAGRLSRTSSTSSTSTTVDEIMTETENNNEGDAFRQFGQLAEDLGATILENVNIQNVVSAVVYGQDGENLKERLLSGVSILQSGKSREEDSTHSEGFSKGEVEDKKFDIDEEADEEVIELEFEKAVHKVHTHNMHCPKCDSQITKVILRRRIKVKQPVTTPTSSQVDLSTSSQEDLPTSPQEELFGCSSCFRIFSSQGHPLNPFRLWTKPEAPEQPPVSQGNLQSNIPVPNNQGNYLDCFGIFGMKGKTKDEKKPTQPDYGTLELKKPLLESSVPGPSIIDIPEKPETDEPEPPLLPVDVTNAEKPEIIKSIIYGGLTESITSLSVITCAAASDATTLNIVALGLANLVGGLFVIGQNLLDLKNDNQQVDRYQEVLGRKQHFLLHATLAMLSYLVFGLVPPVVYGFTFRETDDRDFKLLAVAATSLICIIILATGKAYIQGRPHKFSTYLKTILYYLTTAIMASGVGFAVGDLVKKLMEKLGWFEPNQAGTLLFSGIESQRSSFASY